MLQAQVHDPSDNEATQVFVGEMGGLLDRRENIERCPVDRIDHRGQVDERLDRSTSKLSANTLILLSYLVLRRVRRPVDANAPEVFEPHLNGTVALVQGGVEFRLQARNGGAVDQVLGAARQLRKPFFGRREITRE